ncbi:MAG: sigma-70 family RNA polymerase sigma factor [Sediminibacterium sp.]
MEQKRDTPRLSEAEEKALLQKLSVGDADAYKQLYTSYLPFIHQYTGRYLEYRREDMEEISQEVFLHIWRKRDTMAFVRSFENYLFIATRNTLTNWLSKRATQIRREEQSGYFVQPPYSAEEKTLSAEYFELAKKALDTLSEKRKLIFHLYTQEELSIQEIATQLNMSTSGVHESLHKAIDSIKDYLRKHGMEVSVFVLLSILSLI